MSSTDKARVGSVPPRDFWVLPFLSVLTLFFLFVGCEGLARLLFPETGSKVCEVQDSVIGRRFKPFCTARMKSAEGPWVVNRYNDCGYRTRESCGVKPAGTIRIALLGSSNAEGLFVPSEQIFSQRTADALTARCSRPVQVQNMGREACDPVCSFHRVDEALALKPDIVVLAISPHDIDELNARQVSLRFQPIAPDLSTPHERSGLYWKLKSFVQDSRVATVIQHYLFQNASTYLRLYLPYGSHSGYLMRPLSPEWEGHLQALDTLLAEEAAKLREAHVPFVLVEVPNIAQASLLSLSNPMPQYDAGAYNDRLAEIASSHGIVFVNVMDAFKKTPGTNRLFYVVDGHLNGQGQALISAPLVEQLTAGPSPLLPGCHVQQSRLLRGSAGSSAP